MSLRDEYGKIESRCVARRSCQVRLDAEPRALVEMAALVIPNSKALVWNWLLGWLSVALTLRYKLLHGGRKKPILPLSWTNRLSLCDSESMQHQKSHLPILGDMAGVVGSLCFERLGTKHTSRFP